MKIILHIFIVLFCLNCGETNEISCKPQETGSQPTSDVLKRDKIIDEVEMLTDHYPEISDFPDLNTAVITQRIAEQKEYFALNDSSISLDSIELTSRQKEMLSDELYYMAGPFRTNFSGCSWYCAAPMPTVSATSELDSNSTTNYLAKNIHDFDLRTAWVEGKEDYGINEVLTLEFDINKNLAITHIEIYNGYCKSLSAWKNNSRVKSFMLSVNDSIVGKLNLKDTYKGQNFKIGSYSPDENGNLSMKLEILSVYEGKRYKDVAISEINFDGTGDH